MKLRSIAPQWFHEDRDRTAKCAMFPATSDYDPWFEDSEEEELSDHTEEAKAVCNGTYDGRPCPLLSSCLEFALVNNERWGVWGGTTPDERTKLRKERRTWQQSQEKAGD